MENKEIETLKAEIERFKTEFRGTFVYDNLLLTLTDDQIFDYLSIKNNRVMFNKHQTRQMWDLWQSAKATPEGSDLRFEQEDDAVWVFSGDSHQGTEISHLITSHIDDYNEDDVRLICHYAANEIDRLRAKLAKATPEGFVLVPKECPDPIFADKLFDHLCKKAHGEFGDDQMIFFSDIDESAIWQLMIEAQEQSHD